jgi:colicin import membrane protein
MHANGPDILALAADMPEPATSEDTTVEATEPEVEASEGEVGFETTPEPVVPAAPVPSTKLGWAASLKALEDAGQGELAAHAKRIQADATRKAQEASALRAEAEAMLAEARALRAAPKAPAPAQEAPESIDPWDAQALRAMAQREARALLEAELAPLKAAREAEVKASSQARKEAELDNWIDSHPDFANDESMQEEVALLLQDAQSKGRFIHLDDAYTVVTARRAKAETDRLQAEAKARMEAKARAASKTQASARAQPAPSGAKTKPAGHLSAKEILEIAQRG